VFPSHANVTSAEYPFWANKRIELKMTRNAIEGRKKKIGGMVSLSKTVGTYNIPPRFRCVE
ncbi:MAG: hypothetical protein ACNYWU_04525, partial [Desulfobacterales bacterium]